MGRRRRKIVKRFILKKPPKVFQCPVCNEQSVTVNHEKGSIYAIVKCGNCGIKQSVIWYQSYDDVDAYSDFYDAIVKGKLLTKHPVLTTNENLKREILSSKWGVENRLKSENKIHINGIDNSPHVEANLDPILMTLYLDL